MDKDEKYFKLEADEVEIEQKEFYPDKIENETVQKEFYPETRVKKEIKISKKTKFNVVRVRGGFLTLIDEKGNGSKILQTKDFENIVVGDIIEL